MVTGRQSRRSVLFRFAASATAAAFLGPRSTSAIVEADCSQTPTVRWSSTSERLYLQGGGCITLTEIVEMRRDDDGPKGPLYHYDRDANTVADSWTGDFLLDSSLYVQDNVLLNIIGDDYGGDVNRLLLTSNANKAINLRAYGGQMMIKGVKVRSFDSSANDGAGGAHKDFSDGRSYISAVSEIVTDETYDCEGMADDDMGEARLDIIDSKITQLGFENAESYGVSYKVRGLCEDKSNLEIMDAVGVYGDITDSVLAYNYYGHYSFGHEGGNIIDNEVRNNVGHGLHAGEDSDSMVITGNHVHHNGLNGIYASKRSDHAAISENRIDHNGGAGIMVDRSSDYCTISGNLIYRNGDAGVVFFETSSCAVHSNTIQRNLYAIRMSLGSNSNDIFRNILDAWDTNEGLYALYMYRGTSETEVEGSNGRPTLNHIHDNTIRADAEVMSIKESDGNIFEGNNVYGEFSRFNDATDNLVVNNSYYYLDGDRDDDRDGFASRIVVVSDEDDLSSEERYGIVVENGSCFAEGSRNRFTVCDGGDRRR